MPSFTTGEPRENIIPELLRSERRHRRHFPWPNDRRAGCTRRGKKPPWHVRTPHRGWRRQRPGVAFAYPRGRDRRLRIAKRWSLRRWAFRILALSGVRCPYPKPAEERRSNRWHRRDTHSVAGVLRGGVHVGDVVAIAFVAVKGFDERSARGGVASLYITNEGLHQIEERSGKTIGRASYLRCQ